MDRKVSTRFKIGLSASIAATAAVVTWQVAAEQHRPLRAEELKIDVGDIQSFAAEGGLLTSQHVGASVTRSYAKVHTQMWRQKIDDLARKYESREPDATLVQLFGDVRALAAELHAVADEVSGSFTQNETATAATARLRHVEAQARTLTSRLERESD
jgi:hypothetical protein